MASFLRQLSDADLEQLHNMLRRDDRSDAEIAEWAAHRLKKGLAKSQHARAQAISRYRKSRAYRNWLASWHNRNTEMERQLLLQRERFEHVANLVGEGSTDGFEGISKSLVARLLALAAEADDEALKEAAAGRGWVVNMIRVANAINSDRYRRRVEELKAEIERIMNAPKGRKVPAEDIVAKVDEIMGLK